MWQAEFKLYLYPSNSQYELNIDNIRRVLQEHQFIDQKLSDIRFSTGGSFVDHLTFMGCSPNIELEPQENSAYCYIEIENAEQATFMSGKNTKYPACKVCKTKLTSLVCDNCNEAIDREKTNWRKSAFVAKSWIAIGNIYELEAIPNDSFLNLLATETGVTWKPAYIRKRV